MLNVNEIFPSIQGEGKFSGYPVLFIRLSGCNRSCEWCDTKYHKDGKEMSFSDMTKKIIESGMKTVVWTGGEPILNYEEIKNVIFSLAGQGYHINHHIETNGDLVIPNPHLFDYICFSPKDSKALRFIHTSVLVNHNFPDRKFDVKVVTDLELNKNLLGWATILMPLTTNDEVLNQKIEQDVWNYCVEHKKRYSLRQHVKVWGVNKKGI